MAISRRGVATAQKKQVRLIFLESESVSEGPGKVASGHNGVVHLSGTEVVFEGVLSNNISMV